MRIILGRTVEKGRKPLENQFYSGMSVYEIRRSPSSPSIVLFPNSGEATNANPPRSRVLKW